MFGFLIATASTASRATCDHSRDMFTLKLNQKHLEEREQGQIAGGMRESKFAWGQEESKKVKTGNALAISSACDKVDLAEALH